MNNRTSAVYCCVLLVIAPVLLSASMQKSASSSSSLPEAEIFAPGVISGPANDGSPTFSPDGKTLFFTRSAARWSIILESHKKGGSWTKPVIAPFSGRWSDSSPAFAPDGSYLIFVSVRPLPAAPSGAAANNKPAHESHIWRVDRTSNGWSAPVELPAAVNCFQGVFRPSVAADGTIYFTARANSKNLSLFRAKFRNGQYVQAEPLPFSDGSVQDVDPEIAPDQSFLIFSSTRTLQGDDQHEHLFILRQKNGAWGSIEPIRYAGDFANGSSNDNEARLGPDHRSLYFTSDRVIPVHFPRSEQQAIEDTKRLELWDNSNSNVWIIPLNPPS